MRAIMYRIATGKLDNELKRRGLSYRQVDTDLGYTEGQMARVMARGTISKQQVASLKGFYNIDPAVYVAEENEGDDSAQISMDAAVPQEVQDAIGRALIDFAKQISENATQLAGPMERIAAALEKIAETKSGPEVLPWGPLEITDEEAGGEF